MADTRAYVPLILLVAAAAAPLAAQISTSSIAGTVVDASGAVVPGVRIQAVHQGTNLTRAALTSGQGLYILDLLPAGIYTVEAGAAHFKKFIRPGIVLEIGQTVRIDATLELGPESESIVVSAGAPVVSATNAELGRIVPEAEIAGLPLVDRNVYSLLALTPGVEFSVNRNNVGYPEQRTLINGSNNSGVGSVNFYLDGGSNVAGLRNTGGVIPNPDAIEEFRVTTSGYGAEYGRFTAGVVDVIVKSGTNAVHGSAFEFFRNDLLNARSYDAVTAQRLRRNQYGLSLGGALHKDRAFFFASHSGLRQKVQDLRNTAIVPDEAERSGDFSRIDAPVLDPFAAKRAPFPGNRIPVSRFDPVAVRILNQYIPRPNLPGNFVQVQEPDPLNSDEGLLKLDYALNRHQISIGYFITRGNQLQPFVGGTANLPWGSQRFQWQQQNANIGDTWTISPAAINQMHITYARNYGGRFNTPETSLTDFGSGFRILGPPSLPRITVSGFFVLGDAMADPLAGGNSYGVREVLSVTRGGHSVKAGGDFSLQRLIQDVTLNNFGILTFDGSRSANSLADFLLGAPKQMSQDAPVREAADGWYSALFIQDDFRMRRNFVLNLGLRYDLPLPMTDPLDRKLTFVPGAHSVIIPSAPAGLLFPGDRGVSRGIVRAPKLNFGPRAGFAWDPSADHKTAIRGAFGIVYGSISGGEFIATAEGQPFAFTQVYNNVRSLSNPYANVPGGGPPVSYVFGRMNPLFLPPASVSAIALDFRWPYTYQMNFTIEREVARDLSVSAAYVGALARRLPFTTDANYPVYSAGATSMNADSRRPYLAEQLSSINMLQSNLSGAYHAMQALFHKRFSHNFLLNGSYVFSKSLEGAEMGNESTSTGAQGAQDPRNLRAERARTGNDRRHSIIASGIWRIDYWNSGSATLRALLNHWTLSAIVTLRSGQPFTVLTGRDNNADAVNNDRPNLIGNPSLDPHRNRGAAAAEWFNVAAFAPNAPGQDGNAGRNILDGPGLRNADLGLLREFRLRERTMLQFRLEMTNALNLVSLGAPNATLNSPGAGAIRSAQPMRQTQVGLRLHW